MSRLKRFLAMAMVVIMVIGLLPVSALAVEAGGYDAGGFTGGWSLKSEDTQADTWTISGSNTVEVGSTITLESDKGNNNHSWSSSDTSVATVTNNNSKTATVTGVSAGTVTITHSYNNKSETFTVTVTAKSTVPVTSLDIVEDTLTIYAGSNYGASLHATVDPDEATITWSSSDTSVATVDSTGKVTGLKEGTATITATAGGLTDACEVTVNATSGKTMVYIYLNAANLGDYNFPNLTANSDGWYTIGYVALKSEPATSSGDINDTIRGYVRDAVRHSSNASIPTEFLLNIVKTFDLKIVSSGAADYVKSGNAWHLDLYAPASTTTYPVTINYIDQGTGKTLKSTSGNYAYDATVKAEWYIDTISGYTYVSADPASITVSGNEAQDVINLYYKKNGSITVTLNNATVTYDGQAHGLTGVTISGAPADLTEENWQEALSATISGGTGTDVGTYAGTITGGDAQYTSNGTTYDVIYKGGTLTINPATLTVTTPDASKVYDGTALTAEGSISGFVNGETATFTTTGTQTAVGSSDNTYSLTWDGTAKKDNYTLSESIGTLTVSEYADKITVTTTGGEFTYDGNAHGATVSVSTLPKGYTLETAISNDTATHVAEGTVPATCDTLVIKNAAGEDVTDKLSITYVNGSIKINPATLTVTTPNDSKTYDGTALTAAGSISGFVKEETATFETTGSQTEVGSSDNTYNLTWDGTAVESDYTISESIGTLTVSEYAGEITVTTTGGTFTYDGNAHGATVTVSTLPTGYTLESATSNATATNVTSTAVTAKCDTLVIRNAAGEDVTSKLHITYVDGSITITPAPLTVVTPSASKVYDGDSLKAEGSISGFVNGETAAFTTTGTQTEVGSSDNTYSLTWNGTAKKDNYTINETIGKLTVTENADEIVVTTTGGTFTYDGEAHGATVSVSTLPKGYTLVTATSDDTATHVADGTVAANCDTLVIKNAQGVDVTDNLNIKYVDGSIKINPATLAVTTPDASKIYDGDPLTAEGSMSGLVNGEMATLVTTGTQTEVGESKNTYSVTWGTAAESDYTISESIGTLTVTENRDEITVTTTGGEYTYDGEAHGATVEVSTLPKGYTLVTATSSATATHVSEGTVAATCDTLVIKNAQGVDVTSRLNIKKVDGTITITPATLTITTPDASKVYDGTALTAAGSISGFVKEETATFTTTGTQTAVGSSDNTYSLTWDGTAKVSDYTISKTVGTLTVTEYAGEITVTTTGGEYTYDGEAHGAKVSVSELPTGYTLDTATSNDTATHVAEGTVTANCDTLVIKNAAGEDVTSKLNIKYVDGSITITPATLTVTTPDASKVYDGDPLTAAGSITGFVKEETATFQTTGSQTEVGNSKNTYSLTFDDTAAEGDYTISDTVGTLTVTENTDEIVVTTTGGTFTYDGEAHGATVSVSTLPTGYTLETATSNDTATHVADGTVTADCDTLVIKNAQGVDVTSKLNITYVDGSITITPATLTVTTPDASKVYDSDPLTAAGSISGFVNGETAAFTTTGSQTEVGSSDNTYSVTWNSTAAESDYTINETIGTLTVTENADEIVVTTTGGTFTYDGEAHGATVSVSTLPKGYTLETAISNDTATHVADGTVTANCDTLVIRNAKGENVTSKLNIKYVDGSITITPATLTVTTPDASKVYDSDPLTAAGTISGFVKEESATFTTTGSQTAVGSSDNTYEIDWDDASAQERDYTISESIGTLTVSEYAGEITVTTTGGTFTYDGEAHGATVSVSTLPKGYTLDTATSDDTATHVAEGAVPATCDTLVILNADGEDVTKNLNIKYVNDSITINPATLTVVTNSANKTYDGEALTAAGTITGFVKEETATFETTGTQTAVGDSKNTYSLTWDGSAEKSDYTISESIGTLTVTEYAGEITVTTTGGTFTYDGEAHGATVSVSTLPKGYRLETATSNDTATHVDDGTVPANCDTLVIKNAEGVDVTSKLKINYVNGSIKINPATLTVTTPDASKVYDGDPLTAEGSITGFVNGETATFQTTGTQTAVGNSKNTYSLAWDGSATESDYTLSESIGTLTVTENADVIVVTTTGGTFTYDGEAHGATVSVSTLPKGYTLETATSNDTATHVAEGPVTANCDTLVIKNAQGVDVTSKLNITYVDGSITITPATLTVTTETASKVYDGDPLTAAGSISGFVKEETATFETTGSQTEVGSSDNTYSLTFDGTAIESDYTISKTIGTLTVTENADEIVVTTTGGTFTYDGEAHGATVSVSTLPKGYTLETATSNATATNVTPTAVTATCNTLVIRNAAGEDVTSKLNIIKVDGSITINPATLTVVTNSANKTYDGDPLTAAGTITGFVNGESAAFKTTGSQTAVGSSKNTYEIDWNGALALSSNYTISETIGTLTVTENADEIVVTTTGGTFTYDGEAHGATVTVSTLPKGYTLETATSSATAKDVTATPVPATADTLVIRNAAGEDVTSKLNIKKVDGSITINPRPVTVTADAQSKTYGDKDPELKAVVSGTIGEDTVDYSVTRAEGQDVGIYTITPSGDETQGNYKVSYVNNTLTITPRTLTIKTESASKPYDTKPLTAGVESVVGALGTIAVTATGSQTLVGSSENTYKIDWGDQKESNYKVEDTLGILEVTDGSAMLPVHPDDVITKTHEKTKYGLGDTVTFTISVTNIYDAVKTITITEQEGVTLAQSVFANVAAGATVSTTATYTITEKDILAGEFKNVATVSFSGEEKTFDGEDTVDELDDPNGSVSVTKTVTNTPANGTAYALGETITYEIVVKNNGNLTLTGILVTDELTGDSWTIDSLAPGKEETYTASYKVTEDDILAGEVVNVATASGKSEDPDAPNPEDQGKITTDVDDPNGHMTVTKTTTSTPENGSAYVLGETISYKITVKNDGNLTLTGILVTDELTGDSWTIESLAPGEESEEFTAEYTVTEADVLAGEVTNVATAAGESKDDEKPGVTDGQTTDPIQKQGASISVVKAVTSTPAEGGTYALGETIEYKITVTNNGDITVENITVEDELTGDTWTIDSFAPGAVQTYTASYEVTEADILAGKVTNAATAAGESEDPDAPNPEDQGEITADVDDPNGSVSVTKTVTSTPADGSKYALGETITYEIVVENNGNLTLTDFTVEDELTGDTWTIESLAPGAVETYTASYTVTAADIANGGVTNVAVAEGESPDGTNPEGKDEITSDTEDPNAHLTIVKTVTSETPERGYYDIGETITYQIVVTNDGNVDLTNVVTTDELTGDSWTAASLKVGESATYTTGYVVQEADAGTTGVVNTAKVSGDGPATDPDDPEAEDSTDPAPVVQYYTLTVNYVYEDGTPAAATEVRTLLPGAIYNIPSPAISDYTPNAAFVAGTMAAANLTVTITYTANAPAPTPTQPEPIVPTEPPVQPPVVIDTPDQQVVITPDPEQGVLIEEDDNGDIVVTQISEDEVPLADLDLDDHKDCVLHTLFLLAALIVLAVYTSRAKKLQAEIQELTEKVEIEKKKREGQSTDEDHE